MWGEDWTEKDAQRVLGLVLSMAIVGAITMAAGGLALVVYVLKHMRWMP